VNGGQSIRPKAENARREGIRKYFEFFICFCVEIEKVCVSLCGKKGQ
jgi:hypothetical protein